MSSPSRRRRHPLGPAASAFAAVLLGGAAAGCTENAILELYVELPPAGSAVQGGGTARHARASALVGIDVGGDWVGLPTTPTVALPTEPGRHLPISVVVADDLARPVNVRLELCEDAICDNVLAVWRIRTDSGALFAGHRTCLRVPLTRLASIPDPLPQDTTVDLAACEVAGCLSGTYEDSDTYCAGGRHVCAMDQEGSICDTLHTTLASSLVTR